MTDKIEPLPPIPPSDWTLVANIRKIGAGPDRVYIGRPGLWGNPHTAGDREENIEAFRHYFAGRLATDMEFKRATLALKGKTLLCHCKPLACHGDVIAAWLNNQP